jgi:hypothetical protein
LQSDGTTWGYLMASALLELSGSSTVSIPEIINLARDGSIRIPLFQRPFVWDGLDVRNLFDSIYRGFPIGTVILWHKEADAGEIDFGPIHFRASAGDALWVVDGQQRIISLFGSLAAEWADIDPRFEVYFDLSTKRFVHHRKGLISPRSIPVREALETRTIASWTRQHSADLEEDDFEAADSLVGVLRDYRISTYVVSRDDEKTLREVFDRVNSAGKPITRAQVFQALFASDKAAGSPGVVVKELSRLGFGAIEENRVVQSLLALRGGNVQRDLHGEFAEKEDPADWYDRTEEALTKAVSFLKSEGIPHISLMPYTYPLPILAAFFYLHPEPSPWVLRLLSRWLWRSWVNGDTSQTPIIRKAVNSINPKINNKNAAPSEYEAVKNLLASVPATPVASVKLDGFATDKAWGRLILLAMASLHPLRPDGTAIDLAAELEQNGPNAVTQLVRGNRSNAPTRAFWPGAPKSFSGNERNDVSASHVIDDVAIRLYRAGDTAEFLQRRGELLHQLVLDFLNSRLETDLPVRPPLDDLMVSDDT